ncbi:hypothetical protein NDU88_007566 [Pleurodeles waltl]|uniref:Uncharacterized protein n=1 Tax=Pleurodeles waltl TaxID=8319 RepID=A0AAV7VSZ4_PLEWA|nr:hypothetical protein NDU88_007566 [Pleurodeles waltl]
MGELIPLLQYDADVAVVLSCLAGPWFLGDCFPCDGLRFLLWQVGGDVSQGKSQMRSEDEEEVSHSPEALRLVQGGTARQQTQR